ncbi:hypothetical protein HPB50_014237 [Hyalomma asiaticum]|uniref:Uncharacterized protein n=1 Tax=Hyalomma asiaticum TaxID=266040 RepID=A0ACB7RI31_HYAAI|nr:hypothetical protein HPB50_014237 [Hyalomma asiaticum]
MMGSTVPQDITGVLTGRCKECECNGFQRLVDLVGHDKVPVHWCILCLNSPVSHVALVNLNESAKEGPLPPLKAADNESPTVEQLIQGRYEEGDTTTVELADPPEASASEPLCREAGERPPPKKKAQAYQRDFFSGCSFEPLPKRKRAMVQSQREIVLAFMEQYPELAQKASELQHSLTLAYRQRLWQLTD